MKKILLLCAALALVASSAFAQGVDLSVGGCPGNAAAVNTATLDCVNGTTVILLISWVSPGALPDLTGIDGVLNASVGGDLNSSASFWEFGVANPGGFAGATGFVRSTAPGCVSYFNTWPSSASPGASTGSSIKSPTVLQLTYSAYRGTGLAVTANQKLWGTALTIDGSTSSESGGGTVLGCTLPVCVVVNSLNGRGVSGTDLAPLGGPAVFGNQVSINGAPLSDCAAVPTQKHTWGQLKSLYR